MMNQVDSTLELPGPSLSFNWATLATIRCFDIVGAGLGLLLLSPLFAVIAVAVKLTSRGPVFYRAKRIGRGGQPITVLKFRSMSQNADQSGPGITINNDPRVTRLGYFLRSAKLDELPQLINVLFGQMSLVGPRPEDPYYVDFYTPEQRQVLSVRPGITSAASVYFREEEKQLDNENWETVYRERLLPRKLAAELAYLQKRTFWTDVGLVLKTVFAIVNGGERVSSLLGIRNRHFFMLDLAAMLTTPAIALSLRLDGVNWWPTMRSALLLFTFVALLAKVCIFYRFRLYDRYWCYASVNNLMRVPIAVGASTAFLFLASYIAYPTLAAHELAMYRTVALIDGLLTVLAVGGHRVAIRGLYHWHRQREGLIGGPRVLVVGAGEAGSMAVREMRANPQLDVEPVAFVDDDPAKLGMRIQSLPVRGTIDDIPQLVDQYDIQRIVVAIPKASLRRRREVTALCEKTGLPIYNLPGVYELLAGHKTIARHPQIDVNRLLHREPVVTDQTDVCAGIRGATVLVNGAGGSIGSELCRQVARCEPAEIVLLGHGENSIFEIALDLRIAFPKLTTRPVIVDVRDRVRVARTVEKYQPRIIFHAAAHKHVPYMEDNISEAVTNNVLGTQNVLQAAEEAGVEQFVFVSTDKAVNPTSIMGVTKRLAEMLVVTAARRSGRAYLAVRFGNVLGSRGSVVPIFQRQIAAGGPLTITHPDMTRYFMTIPEAVQLLMQAVTLGQGGEIFVLDMGQPVRIRDLATTLIKLSGLEPERDIKIVSTGIRPGEKLYEELFLDGEDFRRTKHKKIFMATDTEVFDAERLERDVAELGRLAQEQLDPQLIAERLQALIPSYQPQTSRKTG